MDILIVGLNHKTAGISERESVSKKLLTVEARQDLMNRLLSLDGDGLAEGFVKEIAVLTTCNRSEFIMGVSSEIGGKGFHAIKDFIAGYFFKEPEKHEIFYMYLNEDAVMHLFTVASSLDSMIIGEPQILGQLKDAYNEACRLKTSGQFLNKLFHKAFSCAKAVRTDTRIAASPVSVSYAAVELSRKIFNSLAEKKVLLIGAGEMGKLTVKHFIKYGVRSIFIANRTKEKAVGFVEGEFSLEEQEHLNVVDYSEYYKLLPQSDIVLCSTGSEEYVIKYDDMIPVVKIRKQKPLFLIDISMPRNIDPEINKIQNVYLFDIDDIGKMIENNLEIRKQEAEEASRIVEEFARDFMGWKHSLNVVPVIVSLRSKVKDILECELSDYITDKKERDMAVNSITNKILHEPTMLIKKVSVEGGIENPIETIKALFNLNSAIHMQSVIDGNSVVGQASELSETRSGSTNIKIIK